MSIHSQYLISQHFMKRFSEPSSSSSCSSSQSPDSKRQRCSEDSASDSESESDEGGCQKGRSELLLTHLSMFPGEESQEDSKAAVNGKSKARIKSLLNGRPFCKCKKSCHKAVNFTMVFKLCLTFWSLTKSAQDCVLWGIQNMAADMNNMEDTYSGSDSESSYSGSQSEDSGQSPKTKQLNCWYIQGRALAAMIDVASF